MVTKPQDIVVALKLALGAPEMSYAAMSKALGMSASEIHAAVRRLIEARLVDPVTKKVRITALRDFLVHGVPYAFPVNPQEVTRGMPTAWAAPAMSRKISSSDQLPPVWPDPEGGIQGVSVRPLYASVPGAARRDSELYHLLALVDALRMGRARERAFAEKEIGEQLNSHAAA